MKKIIGIIYCILWFGTAEAAENCPQHFADGVSPIFTNQKLKSKTEELCFTSFALMHSGISRTAFWSAEHLTSSSIASARTMVREDSFHAEPKLSLENRSELSDYRRSGFDRGHLSPNGDMPDQISQSESFSLSNMIPQNPENNRGIWSEIESSVRAYTMSTGELYVVTGPIYSSSNLSSLNGRVLVPDHIYKAVFDPKNNVAGAYVVENQATSEYLSVTIDDLTKLIGIDVFPSVEESVKAIGMDLPKPKTRRK